ncbi:addiction module protein [Planctomicrobium piriforme]|uniref:Putative addiction module component, TIGR02574 family n=1 Tax=Planctomicrobium piriforme TaxID=1576369 RepID=A0A1I3SDB6_9PLAN|nr:addiction module protein [Planctomicrobium piriforme]SFJ55527.1 putative addiction module component, TIGR02574 family [Planctomicrobium piriforme]
MSSSEVPEIRSDLLSTSSSLSEEEWRVELVRRRDEYLKNPATGISWDDLKADGNTPDC